MKKNFRKAAVILGLSALLSGCTKAEDVSIIVKVPVLSMNTIVDPEIKDASEFLQKAAAGFESAEYLCIQ